MSRIGKKPIAVPAAVTLTVADGLVTAKGPKGELKFDYHPSMTVTFEDGSVSVTRPNDTRLSRALHGTTRAIINNMIAGVQTPFERKLEIQGVGYNANLSGKKLKLQVGFANTIELDLPAGVECELPDNTHIIVRSCDKHAAGQFAANIRAVRPPEPYKGKGIRYQGENVRRKAGKAMAK
ncbi:MAG: 50S ribosomal protein L6 [Planctomycetota bacterium]